MLLTPHARNVEAAVAGGNWDQVHKAFLAAWEAGEAPNVGADVVRKFLLTSGSYRPLSDPVRRYPAARRTLGAHYDTAVKRGWIEDGDYAYVVPASIHPEQLGARWLAIRGSVTPPARREYLQGAVSAFCDLSGREAARARVPGWWQDCELEEEREGLLSGLMQAGALSRTLLIQLGPGAGALARRLTQGSDIDASVLDEVTGIPVAVTADPMVANRLSDLASIVTLPLSALDARFPAPVRRADRSAQLLERALQRLRYREDWHTFARELHNAWAHAPTPANDDHLYAFPLMRLLHLRLILEQPELRAALQTAGRFINHDVMLYVLGRDAVVYLPRIRVSAGGERRWRATWAESMGEALAAMILEDRLGLDLVTLARIPEASEATPDFIAETGDHARIVFEAKGATDWKTHLGQRVKARRQLGKDVDVTASWGSANRAYACCFLGAREGTSAESLLHVEDPPFAFDSLFHEGWREAAMRRHFAAVLGAAGLPQAAFAVLTRSVAPEVSHEALTVGVGEQAVRFTGTYRELEPTAKDLGHPRPWIFQRVRMFTGIDARTFDDLTGGRLPLWATRMTTEDVLSNEQLLPAFDRLPSVAPLDGENRAGGVYSVLSDGAILAFEVQR